LLECCHLRVKDIDVATSQIVIRDGKRREDRVTMLPAAVKAALIAHLTRSGAIPSRPLDDSCPCRLTDRALFVSPARVNG
jgi:integrase